MMDEKGFEKNTKAYTITMLFFAESLEKWIWKFIYIILAGEK